MFDLNSPFRGDSSLPDPVITKPRDSDTLYSYYDPAGALMGSVLIREEGDTTIYRFFDGNGVRLGAVEERVQPGLTDLKVFDAAGDLVSRERTTSRDEYTLHETWDETGFTGARKTIHTDTTEGVQIYDDGWKLISAHLEVDNGTGTTQEADYGPGWFVVWRKTVEVKGNVTTTTIEENGAGNIVSGEKVTVKESFTLIESFGPGWTLTGARKMIHTDTTQGVQIYDGDWILISAHLEVDNGDGMTQAADYGPGWFVVWRKTVEVKGNVTTTTIERNGAGNIASGKKVTEKAAFTLIETFGPGWTLTGAVKKIHTPTKTGKQIYDAEFNLLSASLVIIEGNRHVTEEYGKDWELISRLRVTTTENKVSTEYLTGKNAELQWRTQYYGEGPKDENKFVVFKGDGDFEGTSVRDVMRGDKGDDIFVGKAGDDDLRGGDGDDRLEGGRGDDRAEGGKGSDTLLGGLGDDRLRGGNDADLIQGGDGDDRIEGGRGDDTLLGGAGKDDIKGGSGDDTIEGGLGADKLSGGNGDDTIRGGDGNDDIGGGSGRDSIRGGDGNDEIGGGNGDDAIRGGDGDDDIDGGSGHDLLIGGSGADKVHGSNGKDRLIAGGDGDTLSGGSGADVFVFGFTSGGSGDVVTDFSKGSDKIEWHSPTSSTTFTAGFVPGLSDQLYIVEKSGDSIVKFDADGDGSPEYSFVIEGVTGLDAGDFIF
ncbi:hemolysin type calcium-binding protein [Aliiruegeria haliotis]|uniref:Hemolysin type calcium-binding protein n=1 Tax=Aliiruegeria haliotis TaxID=1280846 RepID=A0A2T0S094_9RHOB|nr:calcium-binding protein [Aliiruegeria haliotis]PRY26820.1 hemolysin type calcium-binding protein [Aliiruegeria haliotis]